MTYYLRAEEHLALRCLDGGTLRGISLVTRPDGGVDMVIADPKIERIFERSHLRRGRMATRPVFKVTTRAGKRWCFGRRKDAQAFIERGCVCPAHHPSACYQCGGSVEP